MKVFVKSKSGKWLMPTTAPKARKLLKDGKAKVIKRTPFSIQLTYETTEFTQPIVVGIDDGGKKVGIAAVSGEKTLYQEELSLRIDVKSKMDTRRMYRRSRRSRKTRYRKARFLNRKKIQALPPSIKSKKDAIANTIKRIPLPRPTIIRLEDCYFDTQAIENPNITGKEYQEGPLLYAKNYKQAAKIRDGYKCRICGDSENLQVHHIKYTSKGGTDKLSNLMTLCEKHHWEHHNEGLKLPKQKSISYKSAAHVQQGKNYLKVELSKIALVQKTYGYITAHFRKLAALDKSHTNDAVIIANKKALSLSYYYKTVLNQNQKRSLHEGIPRKGRKEPNRIQKRNAKNTYQSKGVKRWDCVLAYGEIGYVLSFSGCCDCRIIDIDGDYIRAPNRKNPPVAISKIKRIYGTQGRLMQLVTA